MKTNQNLTSLAVVGFLIVSYGAAANGEDFEPGEPVGFPYNGSWHVGSVVAVQQGRIKIRAELDGSTSEGVFALRQVVRPPGTSGYRFWSDATKAFRVKAALIDIDATNVRLRKPEGDTITVAIAKLSQADQDFAARMRSASVVAIDFLPSSTKPFEHALLSVRDSERETDA